MYDREINGEEFSFGVSGKLIRNVLVMYDRETETVVTLLEGDQFPRQKYQTAWSTPSWSPDSRQLVFMSNHEIWLLELFPSYNRSR